MNHGATASALDEAPVHLTGGGEPSSNAASSTTALDSRASPERIQAKAKLNSLSRLLHMLDSLIYLELCTIYYMDNIALLLFLRIVVQFTYLTPKPANMPLPKHRPYIGAIVGTNLLCILLHIFFAAPAAGELTRGYLHGSLIIDFVGQKGPTSKIRLLATDLVVLGLQLLSLCVIVELGKEKDRRHIEDEPATEERGPAEDHDTERLSQTIPHPQAETEEGIELQNMQPANNEQTTELEDLDVARDNTGAEEDESLLSASHESSVDGSLNHPLDQYYSGQVIMANFHVIDTIRNQFWEYRSSGRGEV